MTIRHHPSDETLARFASGALGAGPALVVEAHLATCGQCRDRVEQFTSVAAAMMRDLPPVAMAEDALARTLAMLERPEPAEAVEAASARPRHWPKGIPIPPALIERDIGRWIWFGPGVRVSRIAVPEDPKANVILLWVKPGTKLPEHGHSGTEYTHVLKGSYSDGIGRYFPGDLLEAGADFDHRPVVDPDGDCLCIAAIEGSVRFHGWFGRILRPFMPD